MKVIGIEVKQDKNGNDMKVVSLDGATKKAYVNSQYDPELFNLVAIGSEFEVVMEGDFLKLLKPEGAISSVTEEAMPHSPAPARTVAPTRVMGGVAVAQQRKAEYIHEAQDRKEESIAFFNATNSAIAMLSFLFKDQSATTEQLEYSIQEWRRWFLSEWKNHKDQPF